MTAGVPKAENVGIHALEIYFPRKYVDQSELETFDGVSAGKYTIGLGLGAMAVSDDREDIQSYALTVVQTLMEKYEIPYTAIGRLEVGTETIIDKSKSVKSTIMQLFTDSGNTDIEGLDTTNACYGGTNALFNSINWIESSSWDGRYALVVAGDIGVYKEGSARPTGGAGMVAILLGADAPLVFDRGVRSTHMEHAYDFYKPDLHSEYPVVDGQLSNKCYLKALDVVYNRYLDKFAKVTGETPSATSFDYYCFHTPYSKLVQKSTGRLVYNDFRRNPEAEQYAAFAPFKDVSEEDSYSNRDIEKVGVAASKSLFNDRVLPSLLAAKSLGNYYTGSVYGGLISLVSQIPTESLQNKRIVLFSYGSGLAASMFSLTVRGDVSKLASNINFASRLAARTKIDPAEYDKIMALREKTHNVKSYTPVSDIDERNLFPGTYYLEQVDDLFRRTYTRTPVKAVSGVNGTH